MGGLTFQAELAKLVVAGEKTETRRRLSDNPNSPWWREECGLKVGKDYAVQPGRGKPQIGRVKILAVEKQRLDLVTDAIARQEGAADRADFERLWIAINGSWDPDEEVWALWFEPWARYRLTVAGGRTPIMYHHQVSVRSEAEAILEKRASRPSYWLLDQRTGQRLELGELP